MKILIACEESQAICKEFRRLWHEAYSCDILECSWWHPEWHIQWDAVEVAYHEHWDMMIAHPPCTWLCRAMRSNSARKDRPKITEVFFEEREKAFQFFMKLWNAPIDKVAIENPVWYVNSHFRKPNQIVQPWMFWNWYRKEWCLWTRNLPDLIPTDIVEWRKKLDFWSTKRNPNWVSLKSKTFPGIAKAIAEQWGNL